MGVGGDGRKEGKLGRRGLGAGPPLGVRENSEQTGNGPLLGVSSR